MNNYCLADYVALFNVKFSKQTQKSVNFIENEERNVELPEDSYELDVIDDPYYNENESTIANEDEEHFARDGSVLTKRKTPRVIYSVGYNKEHDKENYYRELIMLYLPWRNDTNLISGYMSYEDKYKENLELIENNRQKYVNSNTVFITELKKEGLNDECAQDDVVTELQHVDEQDRANGTNLSEEYGCFNPGNAPTEYYDIDLDLTSVSRKDISSENDIVANELNDEEFRGMIRSLNRKQKYFFSTSFT